MKAQTESRGSAVFVWLAAFHCNWENTKHFLQIVIHSWKQQGTQVKWLYLRFLEHYVITYRIHLKHFFVK